MMDHDYNLSALREACDDDVLEEIEIDEPTSKEQKVNWDHTPIKNQKVKKMKIHSAAEDEEDVNGVILREIRALNQKMDKQTELSKNFEKRIEANREATTVNKKDISELQSKFNLLQKENATLRSACDEHARYKRRLNLRLARLTEKEDENIRDIVIGILTKVIPMSVDRLRETVDTVHRLGRKNNAATSNNTPRAIIIQFGMRTMRDEVWKKSKDVRVCKELHISFKEDFSKEDRLARTKLWPLVQEARKQGKRAYLKEGYALIDNKRVDPD